MSGKRTLGNALAVLGVVALLAGLAMPGTRTETARTCYDSVMRYGQNCVQTSYQAPTAKGPVLGTGFASLVAGAVLRRLGRDAGSGAGAAGRPDGETAVHGERTRAPSRTGGPGGAETLAERVARDAGDGESVSEPPRTGGSAAAEPTTGAVGTTERSVAATEPGERPAGRTETADRTTDATGATDRTAAAGGSPAAEARPAESATVRSSLAVAGRAAAVAVVGGLVATSVTGKLVGTAPAGVAWLIYVASGLGAVALWRRYAPDSTDSARPEAER